MTEQRSCLGPDGAGRIAEERERQKAKWSAEHDDQEHPGGDLANAAAACALDCALAAAPAWGRALAMKTRGDRVQQLTIAGALCAAEIDRLMRYVHRAAKTEPATEVWLTSTDEERWSHGEEYPSREAAIAGVAEELELDPGDIFYVGRKVEVALRVRGLAQDAIERLGESAMDHVGGELSEGWPDATEAQEQELQSELERAVVAWVDRHGLRPGFYALDDVSAHVVPEPGEPGEATA